MTTTTTTATVKTVARTIAASIVFLLLAALAVADTLQFRDVHFDDGTVGVEIQPVYLGVVANGHCTYSLETGALPPGLHFEKQLNNTWVKGTPWEAGVYTFSLHAECKQTIPSGVANATFTWRIVNP